VLHALQLAEEDLTRWCGSLTAIEWNVQPDGAPSVAFHVRHIVRSIDRLLTYAEGRQLDESQLARLRSEADSNANPEEALAELRAVLQTSVLRIRELAQANLEAARTVGRQSLPSTVGGLLVHIADHTQRHVGQAITTAKIVTGARRV
jgi:uncharacterized damage-inducible protein DinB